jgi:hypothetical protein
MNLVLRAIALLTTAAGALALAGCPRSTVESGPRPAVAGAVVPDSTLYTIGLFEGCPPEGSGGDSALNRLKNRDLPPPAYEPMTVAQILSNEPTHLSEMPHDRSGWSQAALEEIAGWENRGIVVEGYLLKAKQMGVETCNCKDKRRRDYHLWISTSPDDDRSQSIIAEVSPRLLDAHPNWKLHILSRLAQDRARVRLSGWMMWDPEHPDQLGNTRGTLWEIHPVHLIEVFSGGTWRNLDG